MRIAILTLGCKTNQAESMSIEYALYNSGHQIVNISENPDICVINTCTVTSKADYQSRQLINKALKNNSKVIVTGCYAELNNEELNKIKGDIKTVKNSEKSNIINIIFQKTSSNLFSFNPMPLSRHRPAIKVQDGCNYSCSYCAIPMARGRSRSVELDDVINEIKLYESMGYKEIVLTGIHLGTYGLDLKPKKSLSILLKTILKNTSIPRIRLSSLEVKEIDDEIIELLKDDRVCRHLHIPLQSGDDNILKLMNRTYLSREYISGIEKILKAIPDISLGTDVIVGFPGEGQAEFDNTRKLIESIAFSYLHIFPYSQRPKTKAIELPYHVAGTIKKERVSILRKIGVTKKQEFIKKHIGKTLDIVVEEQIDGKIIGTTKNYIKVVSRERKDVVPGMLVNINILGYDNDVAIGSLVNNL
ncbi:tRNA (N(6)-L-threonylcarbamoyladenosine(37)-C(2))-methylthiotran sferase MtaB [Dissulfurispira thermophila]|uniref:tRNA (N(6)-L-threonylcarbamoyladenosine(37)-C(2))-methylthiotransferase n=2 Tax=root TaxID=1 RepID=A0A7G1H209_9BACT|nr:tRNA (N(6)-L-threonylcarbamoyladenosine(37)-C(2))-methylthiotransferase MtaB [Dissulfurispira thermophila]BCB96269.1 tRNA (N(6)-L-threonylcarbamoyladenosine(37)-C(2))-methylthiotran sferase MtaB [Dissulfurispira thermophila]